MLIAADVHEAIYKAYNCTYIF